MRHSRIDLTMDVYADARLLEVGGAMELLPTLPLGSPADHHSDHATATGTAEPFAPVFAPGAVQTRQSEIFVVNLGKQIQSTFLESGEPETCPKPMKKASLAGNADEADEGWLTGFEPATSGTTIRRSNQLSYSHHNHLIGR